MKLVYSACTELDAHQARLYLASQHVNAFVTGESAAFTNFSFTPGSEPSVLVEDADYQRAIILMHSYVSDDEPAARRERWTCPTCGERGEESFDLCWKCETPRPFDLGTPGFSEVSRGDEKEASADTLESRWIAEDEREGDVQQSYEYQARVLLEVLLVFAITGPYLVHSWLYSFASTFWPGDSFQEVAGVGIAIELLMACCMLAIIWFGGEPWSRFGLQRPRLFLDLFGAGVLYLFIVRFSAMSNGLFLDALQECLPSDLYDQLTNLPSDWVSPHGATGLVLALILSLAIGFSEELIFRGYLIPRFELILGSTIASVALSALLFASVHYINQGVPGVWNALGIGIVFGSVFAYFRRLWPLVYAHALIDFIVFIRPVDG
jgi:membrane protease YdiL (CAAX protease family)